MKSYHICLSSDNNYAPYLGVTLYSILKNNPGTLFHFHILDGGISKAAKAKLAEFKKQFVFDLDYVVISDEQFKNFYIDPKTHFTKATYYRLLIPQLFYNLDRVLYLDVDILVLNDLKPLLDMDMGENALAMVPDISGAESQERLGLSTPYYNAGVILFNIPKCLSADLTLNFITFAVETDKVLTYHDQDIINSCAAHLVQKISSIYNTQILPWDKKCIQKVKENYDKIVALHFITAIKPWKTATHPFYREYEKYLNQTPWRKDFMSKLTQNLSSFIYARIKTDTIKVVRIFGIPVFKKVRPDKYQHTIYILGIPVYHKIPNKWQMKYDQLLAEEKLYKADIDALKDQLAKLDGIKMIQGKK